MRLICLADTHNLHHDIPVPEGDILIHAGDFTDGGTRKESEDFLDWITAQPHKHKFIVPGNHDFYFEDPENIKKIAPEIHVLIDRAIEIEGILFYGSPYTPGARNWAFQKERGPEIRKHWDLIPEDTDILITHTPPYGILDEIAKGEKLGCEELRDKLGSVQPQYHLFGHIHFAFGTTRRSQTQYFNLSILDESFNISRSPIIIDF